MSFNNIEKVMLRVYGILINEKNEILLSDEFALNQKITKFPGGGHTPGESTKETLIREFCEEFNQDITVKEHFYTTDFFQNAFGIENIQLISIYYFVELKGENNLKISKKPFDKENFMPGDQTIRFESLKNLSPNSLSLPIDKVVIQKLQKLLINQ